jgi:hypothetical protein
VCYTLAPFPVFQHLAHENQTGGLITCVRLSELKLEAKLAFYAGKLIEKLLHTPIPPL